MKKRNIIQTPIPSTDEILHENEILNTVFAIRGIKKREDLNLSLSNIIPPTDLIDMDKATDVLIKHYNQNSRIVIVGDFDCDGATSTSIAKEGLELLGFKNVSYIIPDRMIHGYGLTPSIAALACELNPQLVITVDCGISSFDGAKYISDNDIDLIITDHHLQDKSGKIPDCVAAINPNRNDCGSNLKNLAGCGVMLYTIIALRAKMRKENIFIGEQPSLTKLLDLVSLGTVADIVKLDRNNRILIANGLNLVKSGNSRPAIKEILNRNKYTSQKDVKCSDWGFTVGPILNAAGRLDNMTKGIEMLLATDDLMVKEYVSELTELNEQRKDIGKSMEDTSLEILTQVEVDKGVVLFSEDWHQGIVGILASRIKDRVERPTICLTATDEALRIINTINALEYSSAPVSEIQKQKSMLSTAIIKGSCRSIPGVHLKHILDEINANNPGMLDKMGGHAMAAGVSLPYGKLNEFSRLFNEICDREITPEMISGDVYVDYKDIPFEFISLEMAQLIKDNEPWGKDFELPVFSSKFKIHDYRLMGNDDQHIKFTLIPVDANDTLNAVNGIVWNGVENPSKLPFKIGNVIETVFRLDINEFRGHVSVQLMIDYFYDQEHQLSLVNAEDFSNV